MRKEFKTKNGRVVLDGAGIEPDEMVDQVKYAPISYSLVARSHIFNFATEYARSHKEIADPSTFSISDADYESFKKWLDGKEYDYKTYVEKSVEDLTKYAENETYFDEIQSQIEAIKAKVHHNKEQDLITYQDEIRKILSEEIVSRYYFQEGMIEASLNGDPAVKEALTFLSVPDKFQQTLTASRK